MPESIASLVVIAFELTSYAALLFWVGLALDRRRRWPREWRLPKEADSQETRVAAIVPARDEADVIEQSVHSLLSQDTAAELDVVLVDDQSADGTADAARRCAQELKASGKLRVVTTTPTPAGWAGKVHAMATGVRSVRQHSSPPESKDKKPEDRREEE